MATIAHKVRRGSERHFDRRIIIADIKAKHETGEHRAYRVRGDDDPITAKHTIRDPESQFMGRHPLMKSASLPRVRATSPPSLTCVIPQPAKPG